MPYYISNFARTTFFAKRVNCYYGTFVIDQRKMDFRASQIWKATCALWTTLQTV